MDVMCQFCGARIWKDEASGMVNRKLLNDGFNSTFKIQGQCYNLIYSILSPSNEEPKFL